MFSELLFVVEIAARYVVVAANPDARVAGCLMATVVFGPVDSLSEVAEWLSARRQVERLIEDTD